VYAFDCARSFGAYADQMVRAIGLLKYEKLMRLGKWFAERLHQAIEEEPALRSVEVIVPVPLHPARLRERGYNQAELIAKPLARRLHLPLGPYLLVRTKPRPARLLLSRRERWLTVGGAYETRKGTQVDNLRVLLIDDVFTTGATLDACARALKRAGAKSVIGLTVVRALLQTGTAAPRHGKDGTTTEALCASNVTNG
jgi:competence protein ComFC